MPTELAPPLDDLPLVPLDDRDGPALPRSRAELEASVQVAVGRAFPDSVSPARRRRAVWFAVATALLIPGISVALIATRGWFAAPRNTTSSSGSARPFPADSRQERPSAAAEASTPIAPEVSTPTEPALPTASIPTESSARGAKGGISNPADALQAANQLRRQGKWLEAERAYSQIASHLAGTAQGSVAALAAASLRLEHLNDPRGALRLFRAALGNSTLAADAELGIADACHALGDREGEIGALKRLVSKAPTASLRERAARRLAGLEGTRP